VTAKAEVGATLVECPSCGNRVPDGSYCGACGGTLGHLAQPRDLAAYAAHPHERVLRPWIATTLFPYLPHRSLVPYRLALLIGTVGLVFLGLLRLTGPALAAAALLVPVLYLLYLFDAGVYEDQPWLVTLAVVVLGAVLGYAWAAWLGPLSTQALILAAVGRFDVGNAVVGGVVVPLAAQAMMLAGPALMFAIRRFPHALDGLTFGAASALGFGLAATMAGLVQLLGNPPVSQAEPIAYTLDIVRRGILAPVVAASLTGLIGASFWLHRQAAGLRDRPRLVSRSAVIATAVVVGSVLGLIDVTFIDGRIQFLAWLIAAGILIVQVRLTLHAILLSEAHQVTIGPATTCPHCLAVTPFMAFCPNCGIARRATPKIGRFDFDADRAK
jgi:hypothetical protein